MNSVLNAITDTVSVAGSIDIAILCIKVRAICLAAVFPRKVKSLAVAIYIAAYEAVGSRIASLFGGTGSLRE
jgi:hypothetical protein